MAAISINQLRKNYGKHIGIKDVSFHVNQGEIFGFVGPNGAGKSTTIRILLNFIYPNGGQASIHQLDCAKDAKAIKQFTGYVPSDVRLYPAMKVAELFKLNSAFYEQDQTADVQRLSRLFDLTENKPFGALSTGNKKKSPSFVLWF